jgi:hypothetical protein
MTSPQPTPRPARDFDFENWWVAHSGMLAATVVALGFLLRVRAASGTFLNPDEALHFMAANKASLAAAYRASLDTAHPPLLIVVLNLWRGFGTSELTLRLLSIIAGTVFCWAAFRWLTTILGRTTGWISLIFLTFLPPMIELSAEIRQYALLLCFSALAAYFLERAFAENSVDKMLLSCLFLYLAMLSHFSGILFAGALAGYSLARLIGQRLSGIMLAVWAAGQAAALGLFIFLYWTHIAQLKASEVANRYMQAVMRNSYFHWGSDHLFLFIFARTFGVFQFVFGQLAVGDIAGLLFLAGVVILLKQETLPGASQPTSRELGLLLLLPFGLNCAAAIADLYPYGGTRHSAFLAPFAVAGVCFTLARLGRHRIVPGVAAALLIVAACHLFGAPHRPYMVREDQSSANMSAAMNFIQRQVSPTDVIFVDFQTSYLLRHYLCRERTAAFDAAISSFRTLKCGGYNIISTDYETNIFTAETFLSRWREMVRLDSLKPGDTVWVFQAGWDVHLADELKEKFPEFRETNVQSFGRNITIFKLTVGQPMPAH